MFFAPDQSKIGKTLINYLKMNLLSKPISRENADEVIAYINQCVVEKDK